MTNRLDPQAELRTAVATIELELAALAKLATSPEHQTATARLTASFGGLVTRLALGTAPEVRECPACKQVGKAEATLCGYCWAHLVPLPVGGIPRAAAAGQ